MEFKLNGEFVELDNMLKALRLVENGARAKQQIQAGLVKVNGVVESRVRRKLHLGDCIEFGADTVTIIPGSA